MSEKRIERDESAITVSKSGYEFNYLATIWQLDRSVTVNLNFLSDFKLDESQRVREALTYYAESHSATHTRNITDNIKLYLKSSGESGFTKKGLVAFKNSLAKNNEYKLSVVRGFIRQMRYLGLADSFDDGIFKLMDKWTLQGNDKGVAVLSLDPVHGPFSDMEFYWACCRLSLC